MKTDPAVVLSRFLSMSRAIAGQLDYVQVLERFADEFKHLIPHDHLDIVLMSNDSKSQVCYEVGLHTSWSDLTDGPKPNAKSPIRDVLWGRHAFLLTDDAWEDPRFHFDGADDEPIYAAALRSRIIVPLRVQGAIVGSLNISRHMPKSYTLDTVEIAQHGADLLAPYLYALARGEAAQKAAVAETEARAREELLRIGALRLTEGIEHERQRLGMDLHDQTLADLSRLSRRISRLRGKARVEGAELKIIEDELGSYLHELRRIVEDLKPGILEMFGFAEAVDAFLRRCVTDVHPAIAATVLDLANGAPDRLPAKIRTAVYRIVQEALNNAVKHSRATSIAVSVKCVSNVLSVEIIDDGDGFDEADIAMIGGVGHIRTRAALISGVVQYGPGPDGKGTTITISVPMDSCDERIGGGEISEPLGATQGVVQPLPGP
jgi:signal transduction histidine kinase